MGSWRMLYPGDSYFKGTFNLALVTDLDLTVTHLSSAASVCPGGGYSPIDIVVNDTDSDPFNETDLLVDNYDVAENHGYSHGFETDTFTIPASMLHLGSNTITFAFENDPWACTHYWIQEMSAEPAEPPWYFIHITDTHIGWPLNDVRLLTLVETINLMPVKPDFLLLTGDIVDSPWGEVEARFDRGTYRLYREIIDYLDDTIEVYEVPGNHDRYVLGWDLIDFDVLDITPPWYFYTHDLTLYNEHLPNSHNFEHKGFTFVGLDSGADIDPGPHYPPIPNSGEVHRGTGVEMATLNSLDPTKPKVIFMHHPVFNDPEEEWIISNKDDFVEFSQNTTNNVKMVLGGHTHNDCIFDRNGQAIYSDEITDESYPLFVQTGAMGPTWWRTFGPSSFRIITFASPPVPEEPVEIATFATITASVICQANVHIYDSAERHVGMTESGEPECEIPHSFYLSRYTAPENGLQLLPEKIVIFDPSDSFIYEVVGTEEGTYGLDITSVIGGTEIVFEATGIPTSPGERHVYMVDWSALSAGEEGVTLEIDADGDGIFERTVIADEDLTAEEFALQIRTVIDFEPDVLNLSSRGKFVTAYIELSQGSNVSNVDVSSLKLNDTVPALSKPVDIGDYDGDGIADLMVKFDRAQVAEVLEAGRQVVTLTGRLATGTPFAASDTIRVLTGKGGETAETQLDLAEPKKLMPNLEENLQTTTDDSVDNGREAIGFMLFEASGIIRELGPQSFNNEESAFELSCAIDDVFTMLDEGMYIESLILLENDILQRIDGCANIGEPDEDDWITSIEGQALLYPLLKDTIDLLESML